jgi:putative FmdB family regulatory protein
MPLYDFDCKFCGRFELLLKEAPKGKRACPKCGARSPLVWPLTVMRPDSLWAGHYIENQGYFTSESKLTRVMKEKKQTRVGDRIDAEGMKKMAEQAAKARDKKFEEDSRNFLRAEMAKRDLLDSDGKLRPEASKPLSDTPLLSSNDERTRPIK